MDRVTVAEAAQRLGVSQDAVYKRIKRGTIPWDKDEDGKTFVFVEEIDESTDGLESSTDESTDRLKTSTDASGASSTYGSTELLLDELRDRVRFLEGELEDRREEARRKDSIIMALTQRVPELEAPAEPREAPETVSEHASKGDDVPQGPQEPTQRRSWLYRFFFGP
jgi:excisionase family DNA binding protein